MSTSLINLICWGIMWWLRKKTEGECKEKASSQTEHQDWLKSWEKYSYFAGKNRNIEKMKTKAYVIMLNLEHRICIVFLCIAIFMEPCSLAPFLVLWIQPQNFRLALQKWRSQFLQNTQQWGRALTVSVMNVLEKRKLRRQVFYYL